MSRYFLIAHMVTTLWAILSLIVERRHTRWLIHSVAREHARAAQINAVRLRHLVENQNLRAELRKNLGGS